MLEKESKYVKKSGNSGVQLGQFIELEGNTVNDNKSEAKFPFKDKCATIHSMRLFINLCH